ncbi:hypothetical protein [Mangrovicoccus sp. HB161399]|uniref:hypothetical protein n=1 Tax=Mangrovicoccus sp. HB161399 TaxID=2720392 RepID=UPI0015529C2C|nr:hypothetical protein [Mangrovicoccus sp. HB161399]
MSASKNPEEVLASIRRLVAKEVQHQQEREAAERPDRDMPVVSEKASAAARRLVLGTGARVAANGIATPAAAQVWDEPEPDAPAARGGPAEPQSGEAELRAMIREILREEVRTRMGPRINENIRRIVREELRSILGSES